MFLPSRRHTAGPAPATRRAPAPTTTLLLLSALVLILLICTGGDAYAAKGDIGDAGENVAKVLSKWAAALFGGVTGIMAIYYVANRKIGPALGFVALAMLVGGFVFAPDLMGDSAKSVAQTILK